MDIVDARHVTRTKIRNPSTNTFPFRKLPPELRIAVYEYHFFSPYHVCIDYAPSIRHATLPSKSVPSTAFLLTNRQVYAEALALCYKLHKFHFWRMRDLPRFLHQISPLARASIASISVCMERAHRSITPKFLDCMFEVEAFNMLQSECKSLNELTIFMDQTAFEGRLRDHDAIKALSRIRGLKRLSVEQYDGGEILQDKGFGDWLKEETLKPRDE
ncbi:MAG: hypothetical protein M1835_001591 [Candelina submexicana]|nr:MAG: hypothetical protein M1835_001591 [Candelina submexicana]